MTSAVSANSTMGLLQRLFRRRRLSVLAWVCLAVIGLQVFLYHADRRRHRDVAGKIAEEVNRLHLVVENAAKRWVTPGY